MIGYRVFRARSGLKGDGEVGRQAGYLDGLGGDAGEMASGPLTDPGSELAPSWLRDGSELAPR